MRRPPQWLAGMSSEVNWTMIRRQTHLFPKFIADDSWICCCCCLKKKRINTFLTAFTDVAHTTSWSSLFHQFITQSETKWCHRSVLILFFLNFHGWPRVLLVQLISKNVSSVTDEYPWVILRTSIRSACTHRSSSDHSFNIASRSS